MESELCQQHSPYYDHGHHSHRAFSKYVLSCLFSYDVQSHWYQFQWLFLFQQQLSQGKSIDKVTVKDICDKAELNRGTFYLHYDSPAGLLKDIDNQFLEENAKLFQSFLKGVGRKETNIIGDLFASIKMNSDIVCILLGPHGDPNFAGEVLNGMRDGVLDQWQKEFPHYRREDLDFIFDYVLMGSTRLILNWLQDSKGIPAPQFAKRIERLGHHALIAIKDF